MESNADGLSYNSRISSLYLLGTTTTQAATVRPGRDEGQGRPRRRIGVKKTCSNNSHPEIRNSPSFSLHFDELNLVTAFVPSEMACFESSPGRMRRTDVWISRDEMVDFLL